MIKETDITTIETDNGTDVDPEEENIEFHSNDEGDIEETYNESVLDSKGEKGFRNGFRAEDAARRQLCWDLYMKSIRRGSPNAYKAALAAGFSNATSLNIGNLAWFKQKKEKIFRSKLMSNAERNIARVINMKYSKMKILDDGTEEEVIDKDLMKVVLDMSKLVVTTLGKDKGYSTKTEVVGNVGGEIKINSVSFADMPTVEAHVVDNHIQQAQQAIIEEVTNKQEE